MKPACAFCTVQEHPMNMILCIILCSFSVLFGIIRSINLGVLN